MYSPPPLHHRHRVLDGTRFLAANRPLMLLIATGILGVNLRAPHGEQHLLEVLGEDKSVRASPLETFAPCGGSINN